MNLTRRDFLQASIALGAATIIDPLNTLGAEQKQLPKLAMVQGKNSEKMIVKAFELLGGADKFIMPGNNVVIKPNASFANPDSWGNNTNPEIVNAVCKVALEAGARKITVIDYPLFKGAKALKINGIAKACEGISKVHLNVLNNEQQFRKITVKGGTALKEVAVARDVLDSDCLINLPVAKAHDAVAASIGLKNLMGVIWDRTIFHTMLEIHQALADLSLAVRPNLTIVDMTRIMVTNGPKGPGKVEIPKMVIASRDPVAADSFSLSQARFNGRKYKPKQLRYLKYANKIGLGEINLKKLTILKDNI